LVTFGALPYSNLDNEQVIRQVFCDGAVRLSQPEVPVSNIDKLLVSILNFVIQLFREDI